MRLDEIRNMIKSSLRRTIKELAASRREVPESFLDFRTHLVIAMSKADLPVASIALVNGLDDPMQEAFVHIWDAYSCIIAELHGTTGPERKSLYREVAPDYVREAVVQVLNVGRGLHERVEFDPRADDVVDAMFFVTR